MSERFALCAKSQWLPSIRREHAFARQAIKNGIDTTFVEAPQDIRDSMKVGLVEWTKLLRGKQSENRGGPVVVGRSTPVPGHRHRLAAGADNSRLRRTLTALGPFSSVVVTVPWQWAATSGFRGRRTFDAADDWTALIPQRKAELLRQYALVADQADAVIVANPALAELFPGRDTHFIPNAADRADIASEPAVIPGTKRLVYVGTLSERFDAELVAETLALLPEWKLDLFGQCRYSGAGDQPGQALRKLLSAYPGRVLWKGVVSRTRLPQVIDSADVFFVPNVAGSSAGQSSMKAFDCAARGRAMVTTEWPSSSIATLPPHSREIATAAQAAEAIVSTLSEPRDFARHRCEWARGETWDARWPAWASAVGLSVDPAKRSMSEGALT